MLTEILALRDTAAERELLTEELLDDPDCLAELEHTYSVFRFRYTWGTVFEHTFSNLADAHDRRSCMALMPAAHVYLETVPSNTLGVGVDGVTVEYTNRYVTADV